LTVTGVILQAADAPILGGESDHRLTWRRCLPG
jgi:hypothetical protein